MDGSPLSFGNAATSDKTADRVSGLVHYAIGFVSGLVWHLRTPRDVRRRQSRQRWASEWGQWVRRLTLAPQEHGAPVRIASLRKVMVGMDRAAVIKLLGPPAASSSASSPAQPKHYWQADLWYYALDPVRRHAVAVSFAEGRVEAVDWITGPPR